MGRIIVLMGNLQTNCRLGVVCRNRRLLRFREMLQDVNERQQQQHSQFHVGESDSRQEPTFFDVPPKLRQERDFSDSPT